MIVGFHTLADICTIATADIHRISTRTIISTCAFYSFIRIKERGKKDEEFFFSTITHIFYIVDHSSFSFFTVHYYGHVDHFILFTNFTSLYINYRYERLMNKKEDFYFIL